MGNAKSKSGNTETINEINKIATDYILDNPDMNFLLNPKYCSELNILTKKAFDKNFTLSEIEMFGQAINSKEKIYSISTAAWNKERIVDPVRKEHMCEQLSKFYVKIAHVFAAIVDTIKPVSSSQDPSYKKLMSYSSKRFSEIPHDNFCLNRLKNLESVIKDTNKADKTICQKLKDKDNYDIGKWKHEIGSKTFTDLFTWEDEKTKKILYENSIKLFSDNLTGIKGKCSNRNKTYNENKNQMSGNINDIPYSEYCSTRLCNEFNKNLNHTCIDHTKLGVKYKQHIKNMRKRYYQNLEKLYGFIMDIFEKQDKRWIIKSSLTENKLDKMIPKVREAIAKCYFDCNNDYIKGLKIYTSVYEYYLITNKDLIDCHKIANQSNLQPPDENQPAIETNNITRDPERREPPSRDKDILEPERREPERRDPPRRDKDILEPERRDKYIRDPPNLNPRYEKDRDEKDRYEKERDDKERYDKDRYAYDPVYRRQQDEKKMEENKREDKEAMDYLRIRKLQDRENKIKNDRRITSRHDWR